MYKHRVDIQFINPLTRLIQTCGIIQCNKDLTESVASSLDCLRENYDVPVEVLSLYVSVETV